MMTLMKIFSVRNIIMFLILAGASILLITNPHLLQGIG